MMAILTWVKWNLRVVYLICISLMFKDVDDFKKSFLDFL